MARTSVGGALSPCWRPSSAAAAPRTSCATCADPPASPSAAIDWFERRVRRGSVRDAETALLLWQGDDGDPPRDLLRLRAAAERSPAELAAEVAALAATMASRPLRDSEERAGAATGRRARAARRGGDLRSALADLAELGELGDLAPGHRRWRG